MCMRRVRRRRRRGRLPRKTIVTLVLLLILILLLDCRLRPLLKTLTETQARQISTVAINEAITELMEREEEPYKQLVRVETSGEGKVNAVKTDISAVNHLKARAATRILEKFREDAVREMKIPIGTLLGNDFTRGRGPKLPFLVELKGNVNTGIYSDLDDAGINQTIHKIMLKVSTDIYAMIPGCHVTTKVETEFCIAETVIVGEVPESYVNLAGEYASGVTDYVK